MRKIKSAVAAAAVAAGVLASPLAAGTANAANAESVYIVSFIDRCASVGPANIHDCFQLGTFSTYSQTQIWINGKVFCHPYAGTVHITWCGVGGGNGTGALNIGDNFNFPNATGGLYERMNIYAGGAGCSTWGSNSDTNGVHNWWNDGYGPGAGDNGAAPLTCDAPQ
jgi:hypothetical protein